MIASWLEQVWPYLSLAGVSFLGATLLPMPSEVALVAYLKLGLGSPWLLITAATVGNVGGAVLNWWMGGAMLRFQNRRWFPFTPAQIDVSTERFRRYGLWLLLLSWLPIIGDPLTLVAGLLRTPFWLFLPAVAIGKAARYVVVAWFAQ